MVEQEHHKVSFDEVGVVAFPNVSYDLEEVVALHNDQHEEVVEVAYIHVYDIFSMVTHAKPLINIEYFVAFGELEGYVRDESGRKYILDGMLGMGEDKTLLL